MTLPLLQALAGAGAERGLLCDRRNARSRDFIPGHRARGPCILEVQAKQDRDEPGEPIMGIRQKLIEANAKMDAKVQGSLAEQKVKTQHSRDMDKYQRENKIPSISLKLRFSRDGLIHFKGQSMPVLGSVARVETSGSISRTGGFWVSRSHDDRQHWLIIDSDTGTFEIGVKGAVNEKKAREIAMFINVANKPVNRAAVKE